MGRLRGPLHPEEDSGWLGQRSKRRRLAAGAENSDVGAAGGETKRALYHCNYCNKDISGIIRIKCAKCTDFDLCVECFSVGVEITTHKSNHPYRVIDNLSFPLIDPEWNADEEILLLEGVEMYGCGNWAEVAEHVSTKTKVQCYNHYMSSYMNSRCPPLPDLTHLVGKSKAELLSMAKTRFEGKKYFLTHGDSFSSRIIKQESCISPSVSKSEDLKERESLGDGRSPSGLSGGAEQPDPHLHSCAAKKACVGGQIKETTEVAVVRAAEDGFQSTRSVGGKKPKPSLDDNKAGATITDLTGYNPKRQEFDPEYDNDAEAPLAEMEFKDNDTETDRELKLKMLHIYLSRLDERKRRKDFILERGLLHVNRQEMLDRKRCKEERELYQRARVFMRYHSQAEHEALLAGLSTELKLRQRIEELQEFRSAGCHTLVEGDVYLAEKKKRGMETNSRKPRENSSYLTNSKGANRSNRGASKEKDGEPSSSGNTKELQKVRGGGHNLLTSSPRLPAGTVKGVKKGFVPLDISGCPGAYLLSTLEHELCTELRLLPAHYLRMKEVLMLKSVKKGMVKREDACLMFKVDPLKTERVFDYFSKMGWIKAN